MIAVHPYIFASTFIFSKPLKKLRRLFSSLEKRYKHKCTRIGNVEIILGQPSTGTFKVTLTDVYYTHNASYNIVSLYKLQENKSLDILFTKQNSRFTIADSV